MGQTNSQYDNLWNNIGQEQTESLNKWRKQLEQFHKKEREESEALHEKEKTLWEAKVDAAKTLKEELEERLEQAYNGSSSLEKQLESEIAKASDLTAELQGLLSAKQLLEDTNKALEEKIETLEELKKAETKVLEDEKKSLGENIEGLNAELKDLKDEKEKLDNDFTQLQSALVEKEKELAIASTSKAFLEEKLDELEAELLAVKQKLNETETTMKEAESGFVSEIEGLKATNAKHVINSAADKQSFETKSTALQKCIDDLTEEKEELIRKLQEANDKRESIEGDLKTTNEQLHVKVATTQEQSKEINDLLDKLNASIAQEALLSKRIEEINASFEEKLDALSATLESTQQELSDSQKQYLLAVEGQKELRQRVDALTEEIEKERASNQESKEQRIALEQQLETTKAKIIELQAELASFESSTKKQTVFHATEKLNLMNQHREELEELQAALDALKKNKENVEDAFAKLKSTHADLNKLLDEKIDIILQRDETIDAMKIDMEGVRTRYAEAQEELQHRDTDLADKTAELRDLQTRIEHLEPFQQKYTELAKQYVELEEQFESTKELLKSAQDGSESQTTQLEQKDREAAQVREELKKVKEAQETQMEDLGSQLEALEKFKDMYNTLRDTHTEQEKELRKLQRHSAAETDKAQLMEIELEAKEANLSQIRQEYDKDTREWQEERLVMQAEIDRLKQALQTMGEEDRYMYRHTIDDRMDVEMDAPDSPANLPAPDFSGIDVEDSHYVMTPISTPQPGTFRVPRPRRPRHKTINYLEVTAREGQKWIAEMGGIHHTHLSEDFEFRPREFRAPTPFWSPMRKPLKSRKNGKVRKSMPSATISRTLSKNAWVSKYNRFGTGGGKRKSFTVTSPSKKKAISKRRRVTIK